MDTDVRNETNKLVRVVLNDQSGRDSTRIVPPNGTVSFGTTSSSFNTFSLYKLLPGSNNFEPSSCAGYTCAAGTTLTIQETETYLQFVPSQYTPTWKQNLIHGFTLGCVYSIIRVPGEAARATSGWDTAAVGMAETRIVNLTDEIVRVVLTDANMRRSDHIFKPKQVFTFRSKKGSTTVSLFRRSKDNDGFEERSCANSSYNGDKSYDIKNTDGYFVFVPE
ncbi:unnamed protein product [Rotaria sp. Silwood2]|nr:unnamed protein product [Rotaria sp. Silwood2]CAF4327379.1 unnamed protein product [Rotaria sp. Silwood2]